MDHAPPFEQHTDRYEEWFDEYDDVYQSELAALDRLVPATGRSLEIGVGNGRFGAPLGIDIGIDPSDRMLSLARDRDIQVANGVAEHLPFQDGTFDTAVLVTTVCFVDDIPRTLREVDRVLADAGSLVVGYIDKGSPVGQIYQQTKEQNPFYREATFVSTEELLDILKSVGFTGFQFVQTVYNWIDDVDGPEPVEEGYGDGSFVGIKASR